MRRLLVLVAVGWVVTSSLVPLACGRDFYLTPMGAGANDGSDWNDAFGQESLNEVVNERMEPRDRLLIGSGLYSNVGLTISQGGTPGRTKWIVGVDRGSGLPVFSSAWSIEKPARGGTAISFNPGVCYIGLKNLRVRGYVFGVHAPAVKGGDSRFGLVFENLDMERIRHGFFLADCNQTRLIGCDVKRYSKHGFRFDEGCDGVELRRCVADCSEGDPDWEARTETFPFGYIVNDSGTPNTRFTFIDCMARNNLMPLQKTKYKNGDGFVVEGNSAGVTFLRCRAVRNQDGGFDLKVRAVVLTDCIASENYRAYRIWTTGSLKGCVAEGGTAGLWTDGGPIDVVDCVFRKHSKAAVTAGDHASAAVTLKGCVITETPETFDRSGKQDLFWTEKK